jgi:hypothetical protein
MKEISTNCWAPHNEKWAPYREWAYYYVNAGGPAKFYYRLAGNVLYNILDEGDYFDEDY